jgi:acetyl-CoA carboxylase biotin carboxyl carrier protein
MCKEIQAKIREETPLDNPLGSLSEEDIRDIAQLVEALDRSRFDFLQLEVGGLKFAVGKGNALPAAMPESPRPSPPADAIATISAPAPAAAPPVQNVKHDAAAEGTVAVVAPFLGRFYAQTEPGMAPFITVGAEVTEDTTVGLIEVMKTFNAVRAGVSGVVSEICVQDTQFVEYQQILLRVRPK